MAKAFRWIHPLEKDVEPGIIDFLNYQLGCFAFKVQTKATYDTRNRHYLKLPKHVLPGTPDIICCYYGLFIGMEVKAEKGRQSPDQIKFQEKMEQKGKGFYFIVRSIGQAQEALSIVRQSPRFLKAQASIENECSNQK